MIVLLGHVHSSISQAQAEWVSFARVEFHNFNISRARRECNGQYAKAPCVTDVKNIDFSDTYFFQSVFYNYYDTAPSDVQDYFQWVERSTLLHSSQGRTNDLFDQPDWKSFRCSSWCALLSMVGTSHVLITDYLDSVTVSGPSRSVLVVYHSSWFVVARTMLLGPCGTSRTN